MISLFELSTSFVNLDRVAAIGVALTLVASSAGAQQPVRPAGERTIVGIVADTAGNVIDSADVSLTSLKRRTTAGIDGTFRFDDIKPGRYAVSARRLGYAPQVRTVVVGPNGGVAKFSLVPTPHTLAPVITSVPLGGLSGVVGDTAYNIVAGAEVSVMASDHRTVSDSLGKFFIDLHPGRYVVRVQRPGFHSRLMSVTIPNDSGRRMVVWLEPGDDAANHREAAAVFDLRERLVHRSVTSKIYTREDLNHTSMTELTQLVIAGGGEPMDDNCMAVIDGGPARRPLWDISASDIELLELYPPGSLVMGDASKLRTPPARSMAGPPRSAPRAPRGENCPVQVYVWLRK